ncbi:insulator su(Hw) mRNA adaptor isoform X2 [Lycorma delicatula]|uniref:insulator su(Hw) mRNA adaptor isoform X2 n=1 Tax=Lycorma delicatula TaxID=130591 RepID=UPI003F50F40D
MEVVKAFNDELSSLYDTKPPISKAKMTSITRTAIKAIKFYKHVVQSVEKFIQKCKPEYKVPGLYVIDSIVRQSRHQFGTEKDVFAPRFARNLKTTFGHLFNCPSEDKSKVIRVLNLWQKNNVFESDVIQPLFDLADPTHPIHKEQGNTSNGLTTKNTSTSNSTSLTRTPTSVKPLPQVKSDGTPSWLGNLSTDTPNSSLLQLSSSSAVTPNKQTPLMDTNMLQQLQQLQNILLNQTPVDSTPVKKDSNSDQVKFDKKLLDFDYGDEEDEDGKTSPAQAQQPQQQNLPSAIDSLGSILCNPEVLRQLQNLQLHMNQQQQLRQQQSDMEEKMRKLQEMKQQEEEFDKHLAQTLPSLPFANECDFKLNTETTGHSGTNISHQVYQHQQVQSLPTFKGVDVTQPPPGYPQINQTSPLEDGERANSDVDERHAGIRNWVSDAMMRSQNLNRQQGNDSNAQVVVIDSESPSESPRQKKSRSRYSRSSSRSRSKRRSRSRSHSRSRSKRRRSRSYDRERDYDRDWEKTSKKDSDKEKERERRKKGLPPLKKNHLAVCSTTLWIGHLSKLVQQEELSDTFGEYGDIVSIDLIPPRGCAFICMNRRQDAHRALQQLKYHKLQGKAITLAWAPGKGMKGKEWKDYWEVDQGVSYIPWSKINPDTDLELLEEGGMFDEESFPDWLKQKIESDKMKPKRGSDKSHDNSQNHQQQQTDKRTSGSDETDAKKKHDEIKEEQRKEPELDIPIPAPTLPGFIPLPDGPQPDLKVTPQPTAIPPMGIPPMGMMPPFGLPNVPRLMGPMGMPMGPGLMPNVNVPLGVPPPGLMGSPLMHQQMMQRMPQPVNSPFNPPPGVSLMGGPPPPLSQIPLPGGPATPDKTKPGMPPLGVPPPTTDISGFTDPLLQMPFSLPPQLQLNQQGKQSALTQQTESMKLNDNSDHKKTNSNPESVLNNPFTQPPPNFTALSLPGLQLVPPTSTPAIIVPPTSVAASVSISTNKDDQDSEEKDKDERENKDKDFRDRRDFPDVRDKERDRDRDYRNRNRDRDYRADRDYRGDKDYRNRGDKADKDYRERTDKDYRERDRDYRGDKDYRDRRDSRELRKDRNSKEKGDEKSDEDMRPGKEGKENEEDGKKNNETKTDDKNDRDNRRDRDKDKDRERDRERDRDRDRDRDKERDRDRERERERDRHRGRNSRWGDRDNKRKDEMGRSADDKSVSAHSDRSPWAHDGPGQSQDRDQFGADGPRSLLDLPQIPPPDGAGPGPGPGPGPGGICPPRGPPGPMGMHIPDGPPPFLGPRGPSPGGPLMFGPRGPPPPQDGFGMLDREGRHRLEGNPEDYEMMLVHGDEGPPGFGRGMPPLGRGMPPPNSRGPPDMFDPMGPPPMEGFGPPRFEPRGPPEGFEPRIRIEFFPRGRSLIRPDNFGPRMMGRGPMGPMFSPRGPAGPGPIGLRGPRPGIWDEGQGVPPQRGVPGFPPPRGFPPPDVSPEEFSPQRPRGGLITRGPMRGRFQGRTDRRGSRWSSASPPPEDTGDQQNQQQSAEKPSVDTLGQEAMEVTSQGEFSEPIKISVSDNPPPSLTDTLHEFKPPEADHFTSTESSAESVVPTDSSISGEGDQSEMDLTPAESAPQSGSEDILRQEVPAEVPVVPPNVAEPATVDACGSSDLSNDTLLDMITNNNPAVNNNISDVIADPLPSENNIVPPSVCDNIFTNMTETESSNVLGDSSISDVPPQNVNVELEPVTLENNENPVSSSLSLSEQPSETE